MCNKKDSGNENESLGLEDNVTLEGNGAGVGAEIQADFPYVDRSAEQEAVKQEEVKQEEVVQTPAPEVQTPAPQQQPVQQPATPPAGLGNMGTFGESMTAGTGDGNGAGTMRLE